MMQLSSTATTVSIPLVDGYNLRKAIKTPEQCHVLATTFATKRFLLFPSLKGLPVEVLLKLNARLTLLPFFLWCCLFKGDTISSKGRETSAAAFPLLVYDCVARRRKQSGSTVGGYAAAFSVKPFHYVLVVSLKTFT